MASSARALGLPAPCSQARFGIAADGTKHPHACEQHLPAIFGGLDQHMNGESAFPTI